MKVYKVILFSGILSLALWSCNATKNQQSGQDTSLADKIENTKYTFDARSANPQGGRNVQLSLGYYSLKVSKDTIESYLPYYGRAYVAPMSPDEGGIKFVSTDFDYQIKEKKSGWEVRIITNDTPRKFDLRLDIGKGGYGTLSVQDNNRQTISFYGAIE